jgi:hypothetical protein
MLTHTREICGLHASIGMARCYPITGSKSSPTITDLGLEKLPERFVRVNGDPDNGKRYYQSSLQGWEMKSLTHVDPILHCYMMHKTEKRSQLIKRED